MNARVRVLPEAEADLTEAFAWYEEAQRGLGDRFLEAVRASLELTARIPLTNRVLHKDIRRVLTPSFPYGLFYLVEGDGLVVLACFHARRDPSVWRIRGRRYREA